jgi:cell wall-associated NlpC family hydrolase
MTRLLTLLFIFCIGSSFSQIKELDRLEMYYAQGHYKAVLRKSNKLIDKPEFDSLILPRYYKALSVFQLSKNERWFKSNSSKLQAANIEFLELTNSEKGKILIKAHLFEVMELKEDLMALGEELKRRGATARADELADILNQAFNIVPGINAGDTKLINAPTVNKLVGDRAEIVSFSKTLIGIPYLWAGTTPKGFDCSGFTSYVLLNSKIELPRRAVDQYKSSNKVKVGQVKPGDLIFFDNGKGVSHVGIIISEEGESIVMIHASSSQGIVITAIEQSDYWKKRIAGYGSFID